jgi:hypothetical protein
MPSLLRLPVFLLLVSTACLGGSPGNAGPFGQTRARIQNRSSLDMDISVIRNDGRSNPLGFAPGNETTTFSLPTSLTAGAAWIRFQAKPVRASGQTIVSETFPVRLGDEITWAVPAQ